jgi:hypothetical protein
MIPTNIFSYLLLLLYTGCLERVTGDTVALDERFFKDVGSNTFSSDAEETITISGMIRSDTSISIDLDLRTPDSSVEGGMKSQGKFIIKEPGIFSIQIPKNIGAIELQIFQDMLGDGPTLDDPFAQKTIEAIDKNIEDLDIQLVKGARNSRPSQKSQPQHNGVEGEYLPDRPNGGRPGQQIDNPFENYDGQTVKISGRIICNPCNIVDLDLFASDEQQRGGRSMLGKIKVGGPKKIFSFDAPKNFGHIMLEAFVDVDGDGPSSGDLMGVYTKNPLSIGSDDIESIEIKLYVSDDGRMPSQKKED